MIFTRGRFKGTRVTPHQFANDWITTVEHPGRPFSPAMLRLETDADREFFAQRDPREVGTFWGEWRLDESGQFHAIRHEPTRSARRRFETVARRTARRRRGAG